MKALSNVSAWVSVLIACTIAMFLIFFGIIELGAVQPTMWVAGLCWATGFLALTPVIFLFQCRPGGDRMRWSAITLLNSAGLLTIAMAWSLYHANPAAWPLVV